MMTSFQAALRTSQISCHQYLHQTRNLLISLRPDACWRAYEGASPAAGNRALAFEVDFLMDRVCEGDDAFVDHYIEVAERWAAS